MARAGNSDMGIRVFAASEAMPQPVDLQRLLGDRGRSASLSVTGDDLGWLAIEFTAGESDATIRIERFLTDEDELRDELDTWAGWVESQPASVIATKLMQQIVSTRQVFTIRVIPPLEKLDRSSESETVAQWLAVVSKGVYQVDGCGFFGASGDILVAES
jgi:hypothetical protein